MYYICKSGVKVGDKIIITNTPSSWIPNLIGSTGTVSKVLAYQLLDDQTIYIIHLDDETLYCDADLNDNGEYELILFGDEFKVL